MSRPMPAQSRLADRSWLTTRGALRVPAVTASFWLVKGLSTAMGESASDYLVHAMAPPLAVLLCFAGLVGALGLQVRMGRYVAWTYWLAVVMVGTFGTMAADALHVGLGVAYPVSTVFYAVVLVVVFASWHRCEHTLSIHSIDTPRREAFYWSAVVATFAMGTALGDFTAATLHLGYWPSAAVFAALITVPAAGYRWLRWQPVATFWAAYVLTRPLGASLADGLGKSTAASGLGLGDGPVTLAIGAAIAAIVAYLAVSGTDIQRPLPSERAA